jgi:16S rRNA processing protein RimM
MEYLSVGQIVKTVGLRGEVKVYPLTHFRGSRFKKGNHVFVLNDKNEVIRDLTIKNHQQKDTVDIISFYEIATIEEAEKLINAYLNVIKDRSFLKKDEYFYSDLIGNDVFFDNGQEIGKVIKVEEYASYVTLRIKTSGKDVLVPFVNRFVNEVNLEEHKIVINFIEGLL